MIVIRDSMAKYKKLDNQQFEITETITHKSKVTIPQLLALKNQLQIQLENIQQRITKITTDIEELEKL